MPAGKPAVITMIHFALPQSHFGQPDDFVQGRWLEGAVEASATVDGKVRVRAANARQGSNAVVSIVEWVAEK